MMMMSEDDEVEEIQQLSLLFSLLTPNMKDPHFGQIWRQAYSNSNDWRWCWA